MSKLIALILLTACASEPSNRQLIENVFHHVIEDMEADEKAIAEYIHPDFIQYVDGHTSNYHDFVQHMRAQKALLDSVKITIEHCVSEGNQLCTVHYANAIKKSGEHITVKVVAYWHIKDGKVILCDELTTLINGSAEDRHIGSIK